MGLRAGFPRHHLLSLKITDALERFHFVSLTARPLHQPGQNPAPLTALVITLFSLLLAPPEASQLISSPISTEIYGLSPLIASLTLLVWSL